MAEYSKLWMGYAKRTCRDRALLKTIRIKGADENDPIIKNAVVELREGLKYMLDLDPEIAFGPFVASEGGSCNLSASATDGEGMTEKESYRISVCEDGLELSGHSSVGVLYAVFDLLRSVSCGKEIGKVYASGKTVTPSNPLRMLNHWDNMDGSIERGYAGLSFFFQDDEILVNERTRDYAKLIASVGINAVVINNVNVKDAATFLISERYSDRLSALGKIFAEYGIGLFLSLNFASPIELGGLKSADPLDENVRTWWKAQFAKVFSRVPTLKGFLVKADSEGRPGPFTYGRTQADGANMLAELVREYGGIIIWRCFVYNCMQDWRDKKTDRARAGYDTFMPMDGKFSDNVILQIKNGPMDFQIREPVSPLFGGMERTNQMLEVQIAQEYTGQQIDLCYLIPMFKEILDFQTYCGDTDDAVADIVSGKTFGAGSSGIAAVANTGRDFYWTGNVLAAANLYGFGRLAFDTSLSAEKIAEEFVKMTISVDEEVVETIVSILLPSREIYEKYTSPLGIGWMVNPGTHYGCNVDGYEYDRWGTYHRADHLGIGVDRSERGTGFAKQYREPNASMYGSITDCPDELALFFHHLPYTHRLHSGKTVIQHIYDSHFEGYEEAQELAGKWEMLAGRIDDGVFENVRERFARQLENAREWRDRVNSYFYRKSGIPDEHHREIF